MSKLTYDVIIVGAGSIGAPTAYFLAQAGLQVLVVDKHPSVGQGCNKAAIGGIRATHSDPAKIHLGQESIRVFSTWKEEHGDDIEWIAGGYSFVAYREQEERTLRNLLVIQKEHGLNIDWYDKEEFLEIVPALNPNGLIGGTYSSEDGSASPMRSALAFYRHAKSLGARFHFGETVTGLALANGKVVGVCTNKETYYSQVVINAAGAAASQVAAMAGVDVPIEPDSHEAGITEPVAPFIKPMLVDIRPTIDSANYYFYQHATGQIAFCITPNPPIKGTDRRETSVFLPQVSRRMVDLVPKLRHIKVRRTWRGLYPMTPDGFPIVGWAKEVEGLLLAVGMCGQGYMLGPGVGVLLTHIIQDSISSEEKDVLAHLRPDRHYAGQEQLK
ncbi:MAG: FAD-binding oxidoreductase [Chloroflexota bacterium]